MEEYCTPKPNKEKSGSEYHTNLEEDEDESIFISPLKAQRKRPATVADSESELAGTDDSGLEAERTRKGKKKMDTGKRALREIVQEKRAMATTTNNKRALIKPVAGNSKVRLL